MHLLFLAFSLFLFLSVSYSLSLLFWCFRFFTLISKIDDPSNWRVRPRLLHIFPFSSLKGDTMDEIKRTRSTTFTHAFDMSNWYIPCRFKSMTRFPNPQIRLDSKNYTVSRDLTCELTLTCGFLDLSKIRSIYISLVLRFPQVSN